MKIAKKINNINVVIKSDKNIPVTEKEIKAYINRFYELESNAKLSSLDVDIVDEKEVELTYHILPQKFERIRRITGYLVGDIDRWNNAKKKEEMDRVKHEVKHGFERRKTR